MKQSDMKALCIIDGFRDVDYVRSSASSCPSSLTQRARLPRRARVPAPQEPASSWARRSTAACTPCPSCCCWAATATTPSSPGRQQACRCRRRREHAVHLGHHRLSQGRHAHPPQHPEQRLLHRRPPEPRARPTASACRCRCSTASAACSACWPPSPTAPPWSSCEDFDPLRVPWPPCRRSAAPPSTACPPCSSPSWSTPCSRCSTSPACAPASWPARPARCEIMQQVIDQMHVQRDDHLLRPDRGLAGDHADPHRRRPRAQARDRGTGACPGIEVRDRRPARPARTCPTGEPGELLLPRLQRDEGLLQHARGHGRGHRRRRLAALRRPRHDRRPTATTASPAASRT